MSRGRWKVVKTKAEKIRIAEVERRKKKIKQ